MNSRTYFGVSLILSALEVKVFTIIIDIADWLVKGEIKLSWLQFFKILLYLWNTTTIKLGNSKILSLLWEGSCHFLILFWLLLLLLYGIIAYSLIVRSHGYNILIAYCFIKHLLRPYWFRSIVVSRSLIASRRLSLLFLKAHFADLVRCYLD